MKIIRFLFGLLGDLVKSLFGGKEKPALPESRKPTKPPVEEESVDPPDEPEEEVDDPEYDVENETPDDHTERDPLPEPDEDTVERVEKGLAVHAPWKERQEWLKDVGFDPGPIDGKPGRKTQAAVKAFQKSRSLTADGMWGPKTQRAMASALRTLGKPTPPVFIPPLPSIPKPKYEDAIGDPELDEDFWDCFVDLTGKSNVKDSKGRRRRKGKRKWLDLVREAWHQTGFTWKPYVELKAAKKWSSHHKINAHLCFDTDGMILLLHNFIYYLWTANSFNRDCFSFEVMGNFEGELGTGNWYKPDTFGRGRPTRIQIVRCRQLTKWLLDPEQGPPDDELPKMLLEWRLAVRELGYNPLKWGNAHRQSTDDRQIDCGSECWYHIVMWSIMTCDAMTVGPECGDGMKIPTEWSDRPAVPPLPPVG